eukprot:SAG11_NODE_33124_length_279_cov_0.572222_1_plen_49_part_01
MLCQVQAPLKLATCYTECRAQLYNSVHSSLSHQVSADAFALPPLLPQAP